MSVAAGWEQIPVVSLKRRLIIIIREACERVHEMRSSIIDYCFRFSQMFGHYVNASNWIPFVSLFWAIIQLFAAQHDFLFCSLAAQLQSCFDHRSATILYGVETTGINDWSIFYYSVISRPAGDIKKSSVISVPSDFSVRLDTFFVCEQIQHIVSLRSFLVTKPMNKTLCCGEAVPIC